MEVENVVTHSVALYGLEAKLVSVKAHVEPGAAGTIRIVGLASEIATRETRLRVSSTLAEMGHIDRPAVVVIVEWAPGAANAPAFDAAIALAVLGATGVVGKSELARTVTIGELTLSGRLREPRGLLAALRGMPDVERVFVPARSAGEARVAQHVARIASPILLADTLKDIVRFLTDDEPAPVDTPSECTTGPAVPVGPLSDCAHLTQATRDAFEAAVRSGRNVLLVGAPGSGKTMLARRAVDLLPELAIGDALEVASVHSAAGIFNAPITKPLALTRPFRAPHHTVSEAGLLGGGGQVARPGEVSLAHHGVLLLDEADEFRRGALQALFHVLRAGHVSLVGGAGPQGSIKFPAKPRVILSANPCACGYAGSLRHRDCKCSERSRQRHDERLAEIVKLFDAVVVPLEAGAAHFA